MRGACQNRRPALTHIAFDVLTWFCADKDAYVRIGEATEVALRVLVEKIGPRGYGPMPTALEHMTKQERVLHCNHLWEAELHKVGSKMCLG